MSRILSIFFGRLDRLGFTGAEGPEAETRHRFRVQHLAVQAFIAAAKRFDLDVSASVGAMPPIRDEASLDAARALYPGEAEVPIPANGLAPVFQHLHEVLFGVNPDAIAGQAAEVVKHAPYMKRVILTDALIEEVRQEDDAEAAARHESAFDRLHEAVALGVARVIFVSAPESNHPIFYLRVDMEARDRLFADLDAHQADAKRPEAIDWTAFRERRARFERTGNAHLLTKVRLIELPIEQAVRKECKDR